MDILQLDGLGQAESVAKGEISALELLDLASLGASFDFTA